MLQQKDLETEVIATLRAQMIPKGPQMLWMFYFLPAFGDTDNIMKEEVEGVQENWYIFYSKCKIWLTFI
jgi:hypothetical protein